MTDLETYRDTVDELDRQIHKLAKKMNAHNYELLVLIREFDERGGFARWGQSSSAEWLHWRCDFSLNAAHAAAPALSNASLNSVVGQLGALASQLSEDENALNEAALSEISNKTVDTAVVEAVHPAALLDPASGGARHVLAEAPGGDLLILRVYGADGAVLSDGAFQARRRSVEGALGA